MGRFEIILGERWATDRAVVEKLRAQGKGQGAFDFAHVLDVVDIFVDGANVGAAASADAIACLTRDLLAALARLGAGEERKVAVPFYESSFELIFQRHIIDAHGFWTPYPMPSVAAGDPLFVRGLPENSWGGASQALTALRAPRWFEHYRKHAELAHLMKQWVKALTASAGFMQQMNPWTGEFSTSDGYSPAMCAMLDFTSRLYGARVEAERIEWNCRLPEGADSAVYQVDADRLHVEVRNRKGTAELVLGGAPIWQVEGICRIVTARDGNLLAAIGTETESQEVAIKRVGEREGVRFRLKPNAEERMDVRCLQAGKGSIAVSSGWLSQPS